ncbi:uncharacterized protein KY384_008999 [Bacidia gigantensis]|uniref:uncharacterized protein n=1 Tax=Bacidia gigantensis TaxID=2732470 RepID=UPI001D036CD3|nr:uncharacterized protein KY384_008999 [Bacidia gigantensis]KAG8525355.1 hypothetical protein KY384_008999 [Bacidia gigantensis]
MGSIPLHCSICPKEPDFSDVSHLLTHISSKGHLSHYFKAQVQARQDAEIREKVNAFDSWYDCHQIERLLSQRMSAKQAQRGTNAKKSIRSKSTARQASQKQADERRRKTSLNESNIDPQLAARPSPLHLQPSNQHSPSPQAGLKGRAPVPRMIDWAKESDVSPRSPGGACPDTFHQQEKGPFTALDSVSIDPFRSNAKQPVETRYPDPLDLPPYLQENDQESIQTDKVEEPIEPGSSLKGIVYPGMSLFDSASYEAQRLRNQKKHGSVLEQMEMDSIAIEPTERVFWPDGQVKIERVITGNVESSPLKEPTPLPKPPKRPRTRARKALEDVGTNVPRGSRKRYPKPPITRTVGKITPAALESMADMALHTLRAVFPKIAHTGEDLAEDGYLEPRMPTHGTPTRRKAEFSVFRDLLNLDTEKSSLNGQSSDGKSSPTQHFTSQIDSQQTCLTQLESEVRDESYHELLMHSPVSNTQSATTNKFCQSFLESDKENLMVLTGHPSRATFDRSQELKPRITQRYFSVVGNQTPQFFSSMPPQMEFGGSCGPTFRGSQLNPLSSGRGDHYQQPRFYAQDTNLNSLQTCVPRPQTQAEYLPEQRQHRSQGGRSMRG